MEVRSAADNLLDLIPAEVYVRDTCSFKNRLYVLIYDLCKVISQLNAAGIGASVHWMPLHLHPYYREILGYEASACTCATSLYPELLSLPLYPDLTPDQVERVCRTLKEIIAGAHSAIPGADFREIALKEA